ncbi:MAG: TonB-dependent receptor [Opitutaceae bacterium]|nr:TonB-dependent receptor [Opitutaceae bacterium]
MNTLPKRLVLALISALTAASGSAYGQTTAGGSASSSADPLASEKRAEGVPVASDPEDDEETVILDPFTVTADTEGYMAEDTLGGARTRTRLIDTPSATTVITPKLLQDLGVTNSEDLLRYTPSTETAGLYGNYSGMTSRGAGISVSGAAEGERLANPAGINRSRGLGGLDNTRNYLLSSIPWDGYNISRVDISRGPNSFLFGVGSPSGISNVTTNDAKYQDAGSVEGRYGQYGSTRFSADFNKVIIPDELAVRLDVVDSRTEYQQDPAFNNSKRIYGAVRFDPKFLDTPSAHTKIQANVERGEVTSNNPRTLPPLDYITGYLKDPRMSSTGYNPWTYVQNYGGTDVNQSWYVTHGSIGNEYQWGNGTQYYWDATTRTLLNAGQPGWSAPTTVNYGAGNVNNNIYHVHTAGFNEYAKNANYVYRQQNGNVDGGEFAGAAEGSVTYFDQTFTDRNIFDFFNSLIDGENKKEWQDWNAFNVNVVQSLFDNTLVLQGVAAFEDYKRGQEGVLNSRTPVLMLDLDQYLLDYPTWVQASPNPNLGRPVAFGSYGNGKTERTERENYQLTAAYTLNFEEILQKDSLARILGRHEFTGLASRSDVTDTSLSYKMAGIDHDYAFAWAGASRIADNGINWLSYLGPTMLGRSDAGPRLTNLSGNIDPVSYQMRVYDATWTAGSSVDPTAPWAVTMPDGTVSTYTQLDNPANYRGYTRVPASVLTSSANMDELRTGSSMRDQRISSVALMYQGHFWNDTIIPSYGYRQDKTRQRGDTAVADPVTGIPPEITEITDSGVEDTTNSTSYGVALHLPKSIKDKLPSGTDLSFYYFHGSNETPKVRYAVDGSRLPNEEGETDDYSVQFDYRGRLTVRLTKFSTESKNAQASYGQPLGANGWMISSLPTWTLTMAASALAAYEYGEANLPQDLRNNSWIYGWALDPNAPDRGQLMQEIGDAFKTDFVEMFPQEHWDRFGANVDVSAIQAGDWLHVLNNTNVPLPWYTTGSGATIHGQYVIIDQNVKAEGYELELSAKPTKSWDLTLNVSKVNATQTSLGEAATRYLTGMAHVYLDTAVGMTAMWGGFNELGAHRQEFMKSLWAPYNVQLALTGADQPEVREWRFNAITNYRFDQGFLRGFNVGGALRWEDKPTLGYGIHQAEIAEGQTLWISDVDQPLYGDSEEHVDLWIGYESKLTDSIDWRLQLNARNVGEKTGLVPITMQPNGDVAQHRIQAGQSWDLTVKFMF